MLPLHQGHPWMPQLCVVPSLKMCGRNTVQKQVGDATSSPVSSLDATALHGASSYKRVLAKWRGSESRGTTRSLEKSA